MEQCIAFWEGPDGRHRMCRLLRDHYGRHDFDYFGEDPTSPANAPDPATIQPTDRNHDMPDTEKKDARTDRPLSDDAFREAMWDAISVAFDDNRLPHGRQNVTSVTGAAMACALKHFQAKATNLPHGYVLAPAPFRDGDHVALQGTFTSVPGPDEVTPTGVYVDSTDLHDVPFILSEPTWVVTRPADPLPTASGSVGTATVRGVQGVRLVFCPDIDADDRPWLSMVQVDDRFWHAAADITDYVPLLDGQEKI